MINLDARGISCPEPLIMLKKALKTETELTLLADSKGVVQNCKTYAEKLNFVVEVTEEIGEYVMKVSK